MAETEDPPPQTPDERALFNELERILRAGIVFRGDYALVAKIAAQQVEAVKAFGWTGPVR